MDSLFFARVLMIVLPAVATLLLVMHYAALRTQRRVRWFERTELGID